MSWSILEHGENFCIIEFISTGENLLENIREINKIIKSVSGTREILKRRDFGDEEQLCVSIIYK